MLVNTCCAYGMVNAIATMFFLPVQSQPGGATMTISSRLYIQRGALCCLLSWLAACTAVAPGMHFDSQNMQVQTTTTQEPEPVPIIKSINRQLVEQERLLRDQQVTQDISRLAASRKPYTIDSGDVLSIVVWDHPELANGALTTTASSAEGNATPAGGFVVDHLGGVQFPYTGMLKLAGLTEEQARKQLATKLGRYIRNPDVTLRVQSFRSKRIYIDGDVKSPGQQAINDIPMTLVEALNRAGGVLPTADQSQVTITRDGVAYPVNLLKLVQRGISPADILLTNGDIVRVLSRDENKVFVSGEVVTPKALPMHNGRMTLNEALGEAGGINPNTGDGSQVYVVRNAVGKQPVVYHLDAGSPTALATAEEFELNPKDVVYVDASALATWSRVINLILPNAVSSALSSAATISAIR
jgi:polysaccharide export outer membrane protein